MHVLQHRQAPRNELQRAIGAVHVRFGGQALVRADRLPPARPWPTGQPALDRLTGIGGLPRGRISVLQGALGSGKLSLGLALLARATREFAHSIVLDLRRRFDPWMLGAFGADLEAVTVVHPPTPAAGGEAAVALARAGAGFMLLLEAPPEPALAPLESAAARSGCLVVAVGEAGRPLAHASSLTFEAEHSSWIVAHGEEVGLEARVRCVKNKLAAPGAEATLEVRYALAPRQLPEEPLREKTAAMVELWQDRSAVV